MHDITTGNNGFAALPGYDLTTGWGSPTGQALINDLSALPDFAFVHSGRVAESGVGAGRIQHNNDNSGHGG